MVEAPTTSPATASFYVVSGTLPLDSQSYAERQADHDLLTALLAGEYCFVLNSRQMGKSSLSVRTMARLQEAGIRTAFLDLTKFGGSNVTPEQWYIGLLAETGRALGLRKEFLAYAKENQQFSLVQRTLGALHDVGLAQITSPLVLFIDEIDAVKSLSFSTDEFFAAIRECYNRRVQEPEYGRLAFALVGSAMASDLIQDTRTSPFNIGRRIELKDFTLQEVLPLAEGITRPNAEPLVRRAFYWTNGHPFLTQALCAEIAADAKVQTAADVDRLVAQMFFEAKAREHNVNLADVSNRILSSYLDPGQKEEHRAAILDLYRQVLSRRKKVVDDETNRLVSVLKLSGITRSVNGEMEVRNRIYERVFDRAWIEASMPDAELRRQKQAYRAGMLRSAALAAVVVVMMALLAGWSIYNANRAATNEKKAQASASEAKRETQRANNEAAHVRNAEATAVKNAEDRAQALTQAQIERSHAQKSAHDAQLRANEAALAATRERIAWKAQSRARGAAIREADNRQKLLYAADMNLAYQAYQNGHIGRARELLEAHRPRDGHPDLRGFEWFYIWRLCRGSYTRAFRGHKGTVISVAISPDGHWLASSGEDATVRLWNAATGDEVVRHSPAGTRVLFSQDSRIVILFGQRILLWDIGANQVRSLPDQLGTACLCPYDGSLATAGTNRVLRFWDVHTGQLIHQINGLPFPPIAMVISRSGRKIALQSAFPRGIAVWDLDLHGKGHTLGIVNSLSFGFDFSPDGRTLAVSTGVLNARTGVLSRWDVETGREIKPPLRGHEAWISDLHYSNNVVAPYLASASADQTVRLWNPETGEEEGILRGCENEIWSLAISADGEKLVTGDKDGIARLWPRKAMQDADIVRYNPVLKPQEADTFDPPEVLCMAMSRTGLFVAGLSDAHVLLGEIAAPQTTRVVDSQEGQPFRRTLAVCFCPNGSHFFTGSDAGKVQSWTSDGRPLRTIGSHKAPIVWLACSRDGKRLASGSRDGTINVWDPDGHRLIGTTLLKDLNGGDATFTPDGRSLLVGDGVGNLTILSAGLAGSPRLFEKRSLALPLSSVCFSPDGVLLAAGGWDGTTELWDYARHVKIAELRGHLEGVFGQAFSLDGMTLATCSSDKTIRLWNVQTRKELLTLRGHDREVNAVAFAPNSSALISASADGTLRIWRAATISQTERKEPMQRARRRSGAR